MSELNKDELQSIGDLIGEPKQETYKQQLDVNAENMVELNLADIAPKQESIDPAQNNLNRLFDNMSRAIDDRIARDDAYVQEIITKEEEKELDKLVDDEEAETVPDNEFSLALDSGDNDDDTFEDLRPESDNADDSDEKIEELKLTLKDKIKPVTNVVDLKSFTLSKKHVAVTKTLNDIKAMKHVADWVLYSAKKPISIEEFTGYEIEQLNPGSSSRTRYNTFKDIYGVIYSHIVDADKPPFEIWLKGLSFYDIPHLYFAIYRACFEGVNSMPYACTNTDCGNMFMNDCKNIFDMVKFKNNDIRQEVDRIMTTGVTDSEDPDGNEVEIVQVSDNYAIALREPSVFNIIFENAVLDEKFTEKYNQFLSIMAYIDEIYFINRNTSELEPIQVDIVPNNLLKTVKSRIVKYSEVLKALNSDQFQFIQTCIKKVNDKHDGVSYILPECTCPKCGTLIKEQSMEPDSLLFTRHQLAAIANI